jgi:ABC-type Na+ efflux pump permease subunit
MPHPAPARTPEQIGRRISWMAVLIVIAILLMGIALEPPAQPTAHIFVAAPAYSPVVATRDI